MEKVQSAPEVGALNVANLKEDPAERNFQIKKERVLAQREAAFLYAHLGEPGSSVFESFERLAELAAEEMAMTAAVDERLQPEK